MVFSQSMMLRGREICATATAILKSESARQKTGPTPFLTGFKNLNQLKTSMLQFKI
jgi:hypothetical protein